MNIIGDIAGRFDELMLLLGQMPKDETIVLVGDLVDRGSQSKEIIEWAMKTPNVTVIKGNHEDMMVDFCLDTKIYEEGIWFMNGGDKTIQSYGCKLYTNKPSHIPRIREYVPKEHVEWLKNLPHFYKEDRLFISHAPWRTHELGEDSNHFDALWNRYAPNPVAGVFQIYGHNGSMKMFTDWINGDYAICIDDCSKGRLTGIHWPSKKIYQQDYLKK